MDQGRIHSTNYFVRFRLLGLVLCLLASYIALPQARADRFNTETTSSARSLGMGNAGINTERGSYSVFYNPANIAAKDTETAFQLLNMKVGMSDGYLPHLGANFLSLSSLYGNLQANPNRFAAGNISVYPNFTIRNFSLGMLYEVDQGAEVLASDGSVRVKARNRFAPTAALSFRLFSGIIRLGVSTQYLTVGNANGLIRPPIQASNLEYKNSIAAGSGLSHSGGLTVTLPFRFLPSFSVVARDIGNTNLTGSPALKFGNGSISESQKMTFDAAASMTVYLAKRIESKFEIDYKDTTNKLDGTPARHIFTGAELEFYDMLKIRVGMAHGYKTFGFGIGTKKASLDLAVYSDEMEDRFRAKQENRYVLQYTWGLFK